MTRAERLVNLRSQTPKPYVPRSREQNTQRGDLVIARFFSGGLAADQLLQVFRVAIAVHLDLRRGPIDLEQVVSVQ